MKKASTLLRISAAACLVLMSSCMKWEDTASEQLEAEGRGLYVVCEGNFQYGNASLSYYDPTTGKVENEVFARANGFKLGDVAQSMIIHDGKGWVVVNNSHVIFAIDPNTFKEVGRITGLTSPRYMHFVSDTKAYVSQLWDNRIFIVNPLTYSVTGYINVPEMTMEAGSTEQMVQLGRYVFVNCWSYQNRILKIDTYTDEIVAQLQVGLQPQSIAADYNGKLWVLTDGGYEGSPYGYEQPSLCMIDPESFVVEARWRFPLGSSPRSLRTDGTGTHIYWIDNDVWRMDVDAIALPAEPFIHSRGTIFYGLTVDSETDEVYVSDAIDYQQPGIVSRYNSSGKEIDSFYTGINPSAFCWKK